MIITDEGKKIFKKASDILKEHLSSIPKILTDEEKETLKKTMIKLREGLKKEVEMKI